MVIAKALKVLDQYKAHKEGFIWHKGRRAPSIMNRWSGYESAMLSTRLLRRPRKNKELLSVNLYGNY